MWLADWCLIPQHVKITLTHPHTLHWAYHKTLCLSLGNCPISTWVLQELGLSTGFFDGKIPCHISKNGPKTLSTTTTATIKRRERDWSRVKRKSPSKYMKVLQYWLSLQAAPLSQFGSIAVLFGMLDPLIREEVHHMWPKQRNVMTIKAKVCIKAS